MKQPAGLLITHPHSADSQHSHCGNCGTGQSILVGNLEVQRGKVGRGTAVRPVAKGW